jgi:hypothetical protein
MTVTVDYLDPFVHVDLTEKPVAFKDTVFALEMPWWARRDGSAGSFVIYMIDRTRKEAASLADKILKDAEVMAMSSGMTNAEIDDALKRIGFKVPSDKIEFEERKTWKSRLSTTSRKVSTLVRSMLRRYGEPETAKRWSSTDTQSQAPAQEGASGTTETRVNHMTEVNK